MQFLEIKQIMETAFSQKLQGDKVLKNKPSVHFWLET